MMGRVAFVALFFLSTLFGQDRLAFGPEIYHVQRERIGGTKQSGTLTGGRLSLDRTKPSAVYWGADFLFADGYLDGSSPTKGALHSVLTELQVEGRLGYRIRCWCMEFTPFVGAGYFEQQNDYDPCPFPFLWRITFAYSEAGLFSKLTYRCFTAGVDFKVRYMRTAKARIRGHKKVDPLYMIINNEPHYVVEAPISYESGCFSLRLVPFYRMRHYGGRENYPYDFYDTKYFIWGGRLQAGITW